MRGGGVEGKSADYGTGRVGAESFSFSLFRWECGRLIEIRFLTNARE